MDHINTTVGMLKFEAILNVIASQRGGITQKLSNEIFFKPNQLLKACKLAGLKNNELPCSGTSIQAIKDAIEQKKFHDIVYSFHIPDISLDIDIYLEVIHTQPYYCPIALDLMIYLDPVLTPFESYYYASWSSLNEPESFVTKPEFWKEYIWHYNAVTMKSLLEILFSGDQNLIAQSKI